MYKSIIFRPNGIELVITAHATEMTEFIRVEDHFRVTVPGTTMSWKTLYTYVLQSHNDPAIAEMKEVVGVVLDRLTWVRFDIRSPPEGLIIEYLDYTNGPNQPYMVAVKRIGEKRYVFADGVYDRTFVPSMDYGFWRPFVSPGREVDV